MKRLLLFILLFMNICPVLWAQSLEDKRRVEEEKRKNLAPSESYLLEIKEVSPPVTHSDQDSYFSELLTKRVATLSDAYRVLIVLTGKDIQFLDLESQFDFLSKEGVIPKSIGTEPAYEKSLRKGTAAYMFAKTMDIKGGVILRFFGMSERYAFKELVYEEVMFPGNVNDVMSGPELILTLTRAADYMANWQEIIDSNKGR